MQLCAHMVTSISMENQCRKNGILRNDQSFLIRNLKIQNVIALEFLRQTEPIKCINVLYICVCMLCLHTYVAREEREKGER